MNSEWFSIPKNKQKSIISLVKYRHWKLIVVRHGHLLGITTSEEAKSLGKWLADNDFSPKQEEKDTDYLLDKNYWYDEERKVYVLHLQSHKRPFVLRESMWAAMKEAYSNWDGAPASINEVARKFGLARNTVKEILRVMGATHDSSIWTDSYAAEASQAVLVEDLLQRKLQKVLVAAEKKEWSRIKKDAEKWRRVDLAANDLSKKFSIDSQTYSPPVLDIDAPKGLEEYCAVISPTDFHWGKYAPAYTGEPYNREIAKDRLFSATTSLLGRLLYRGVPSRIILALGGDSLHFDTYKYTTTNGTYQDSDGTPEEIAASWIEMCRDYIHLVRQLCPVTVVVVPGNHDRFSTVFLRSALEGWFSTIEDVNIITALNPRQYCSYGNSMLSFLHGDIGKVKDWPAIIAGENPKLWGKSSHRFIFTGHLHTERELPTFGNVTVYRMPSLAGTDKWHHNCGYKSRKALVAYIVSKSKGVIGTEVEAITDEKTL